MDEQDRRRIAVLQREFRLLKAFVRATCGCNRTTGPMRREEIGRLKSNRLRSS
jgi:hypothetical protein